MKTLLYKLCVFFTVIFVGGISCSESNDQPDDPPQIPPVESLAVNFEGLPIDGQAKITSQTDSAASTAFFAALAVRAFYELNAALPKILLHAADNNTPDYNGNGEWEWAYSASGPDGSVSVSLLAETNAEDVDWAFRVSANNQNIDWEEVLVLSGTSEYDGSEGSWNIYNPNTEELATTTSWEIQTEDNVEVSMNVFQNGSQSATHQIEYTFDGIQKTVVVEDYSEGSEVVIQWNVQTGAGMYISPDFNGGAPACWDGNYQDVTCG